MAKYISPPQIFSYLQPSLFVDSIYYADLFRFNNTIWMITGTGKSKAAQFFINNDEINDLGRDSVAIKLENGNIFGRYDPGAINPIKTQLHQFYKIDYLAYCLTKNQTKDYGYFDLNKLLIKEVNSETIAKFLSVYILYPGFMINLFFDKDEFVRLHDPKRQHNKFLEIVKNNIDTKFVIVPWAKNIEDKARMYRQFLKI